MFLKNPATNLGLTKLLLMVVDTLRELRYNRKPDELVSVTISIESDTIKYV